VVREQDLASRTLLTARSQQLPPLREGARGAVPGWARGELTGIGAPSEHDVRSASAALEDKYHGVMA